MNTCLILLVFFMYYVDCRDFYVGMFSKNDFLVAQDRLYKEKTPYRVTYAKYGRLFKCPISYFRVVDRLGVGRGPRIEIIRGGLRKNYVVLRLTSPYNLPISVNIYVGCENKMKSTTKIKPTPNIVDSIKTTDASSVNLTTEADGTKEPSAKNDVSPTGATEGATEGATGDNEVTTAVATNNSEAPTTADG